MSASFLDLRPSFWRPAGAAALTVALIAGLPAGQALAQTQTQSQTQAGRTDLSIAGTVVTLVYPTEAAAQTVQRGDFTISVATDAQPMAGRRRLVVMAHGSGGSALADHEQAAAFAREGLVVAQVRRTGDHHQDTSRAGPPAFENGPREVTAVVDALAQHPDWASRLALERVGVHGMSAGGAVALSLVGAQWRLLNLVRHCAAHDQDDPGFCYQGAVTADQRDERRRSFHGAQGVPDAYLPAFLTTVHGAADPRFAVATLSVPVAAIFAAEALQRVSVPVGVVSATQDEVLLPRFHADHVLREVPKARSLAVLQGAGHFDVLAPWPAAVARQVASQQIRGGAPVAGFDARQRVAAQAAVARFQREQLGPASGGAQPAP